MFKLAAKKSRFLGGSIMVTIMLTGLFLTGVTPFSTLPAPSIPLRIGTGGYLADPNPMGVEFSFTAMVLPLVFEPMMRLSLQGIAEPVLCQEVIMEPGSWRCRLKQMRFANGKQVMAKDVVLSTENRARTLGLTDHVPVRAIGDSMVVVDVDPQAEELLNLISAPVVPNGEYQRWPIYGTGPYHLTSFGDENMVLEKNKYYHGPHPASSRLEIVAFPTIRRAMGPLFAEELDLVYDQQQSIAHHFRNIPDYQVVIGDSNHLLAAMFNCNDPLLADSRIRHALNLIVDRERIMQDHYPSGGQIRGSIFSPLVGAFSGSLPQYDPDTARTLLQEAGLDWDSENNLVGTAGELITWRMLVPEYDEQFRLIAEEIQADFRVMGIGLEIQGQPLLSFVRSFLQLSEMNEFHMALAPINSNFPHSVRRMWVGNPNNSITSCDLDQVRQYFDQTSIFSTKADNLKWLTKANRLVAEDSPGLMLFSPNLSLVSRSHVEGLNNLLTGFQNIVAVSAPSDRAH